MYKLTDQQLAEKIKQDKTKSKRGLSAQYKAVNEDFAFYAGDKAYYTGQMVSDGQKKMVVFNRIKPFVNGVLGFMIQLRRKPEYQAKDLDSQKQQLRSLILNTSSDYFREIGNASVAETQQDKDMLICGYGCIDTAVSDVTNPKGNILWERVHPLETGWDPLARATNLLDATYVWREKKFTREDAKVLFDLTDEDLQADDGRMSQPIYNPYGGTANAIQYEIDESNDNIVIITYYQCTHYEKYFRINNPIYTITDPEKANQVFQALSFIKQNMIDNTKQEDLKEEYNKFDPKSETLLVDAKQKSVIEKTLSKMGIEIEFIDCQQKVYYTTIASGDKIIKRTRSAHQTGFTLQYKTADFDDRNNKWFGMVASLKEPARYANKAFTELLYIIASNSKGGVLYEEDAVLDASKFEQEYASTKSTIKVKRGALSGNKIQPKAQGQVSLNGYDGVLSQSLSAMPDVVGVNPEFLASSTNQQVSGVLEAQRIKQVTMTLAPLIDSVTMYQKENARLVVTYIKILTENNPDRIVPFSKNSGYQGSFQLKESDISLEFDVFIGESPETPTQREEQQKIMIDLATNQQQYGINIWPVAVKYLNIKQSDTQEIIKIMQPQQQAPDPMEEEGKMLLLEAQKAAIAKDIAEAKLKTVDADVRSAQKFEVQAKTMKTHSEAQQKDLENRELATRPPESVQIVI